MLAPICKDAGIHTIFDIRQDIDYLGVPEDIVSGLCSDPPSLPSFILWDEKGQELFDRFSQTASYYPFHSEIEILNRCATEIAGSVPSGGALIELGCGTIRKTKKLLSVFDREQKPIHYYALDLSPQALTDSITKLSEAMHGSKYLTITGLLGTYEDCISWVSQTENLHGLSSITFLWMGNSIANFQHHSEASTFLARFKSACQLSRIDCNFLISTDICDQDWKVNEAYNPNKNEFQAWYLNGLTHANTALGQEVLRLEDWKLETEFNPQEYNLKTYYTALSDVIVHVTAAKAPPIMFCKGSRIRCITSGKWSEEIMDELSDDAGFYVQQRWKDQSGAYCLYRLASIGK